MNYTKIYIKVKEFPEHELPLLFSFPPGISFDESHDSLLTSNVLSIQNIEGFTRVYALGLLGEKDLKHILKKPKKVKKRSKNGVETK